MACEDELTSIADAVDLARRLGTPSEWQDRWEGESSDFATGIWFRGVDDLDYLLCPSAFREGSLRFAESRVVHDFMLHAPERRGELRSTLEWLTYMQHYEVPTRLLDWTESILVALYFACAGRPERPGKLCVLHARKLNAVVTFDERPGLQWFLNTPESFNAYARAEGARFRTFQRLLEQFRLDRGSVYRSSSAVTPLLS